MKLCPTYRLAHAYLLKVYEKERHIFRIFVSGGQPEGFCLWYCEFGYIKPFGSPGVSHFYYDIWPKARPMATATAMLANSSTI
jgi:hypothetical protein